MYTMVFGMIMELLLLLSKGVYSDQSIVTNKNLSAPRDYSWFYQVMIMLLNDDLVHTAYSLTFIIIWKLIGFLGGTVN